MHLDESDFGVSIDADISNMINEVRTATNRHLWGMLDDIDRGSVYDHNTVNLRN